MNDAPTRLRVLSLNIAHGRGLSAYQGFHSAAGIEKNLRRIARLLRNLNPDIVAMQEVDEDSHWNRRINLLEFLAREAGYDNSHLGVNNRRGGRLPLAYGNGILSRYEIKVADNQPFGTATLGEKGFQYVEVELPAGHLPVINLHLDFRSRRRRIVQVEQLIGYLEQRHSESEGEHFFSPVVCGDFNSRSAVTGDAVKHLFGYLESHCGYAHFPENKKTFPAYLPRRAIDFIFVPSRYRHVHCDVVRSYVSDHRPVLLEIEIGDLQGAGRPAEAEG